MRRIGELVLHHRKLVVIGWLVIFVFGGIASGTVSKRLKVDFSLPGEPGTKTAKQIEAQFGNGGFIEGARTTAAMAASRFGPVLKVSEDGEITFYDRERVWDI